MCENRLKQLRQSCGLSRKRLSEISGVNLRSIQDYEQGHKDLAGARGETLYRMSMALGCTVEELLEACTNGEIIRSEPARGFAPEPETYTLKSEELTPEELKMRIELQKIYVSQYQIYARWRFVGKDCVIVFVYEGKVVRLSFNVVFTEKYLPWLVDAAAMRIESYVENLEFNRRFWVEGCETWDES